MAGDNGDELRWEYFVAKAMQGSNTKRYLIVSLSYVNPLNVKLALLIFLSPPSVREISPLSVILRRASFQIISSQITHNQSLIACGVEMKKIIVIGAGVNGLSSAVKIAELYFRQSVEVTLVSEDVSPNTTGDISAGLWGPYLIGSSPEQKIV